jgi:hypothetical protein
MDISAIRAYFDLLGERSHLFYLAHILFYLRWLWRAFIRRCVAYLESHACGFCMLLVGHLSIFGDSSWGVHMWKFLLAIFGDSLGWCTYGEMFYFLFWGVDHILSCGVLHLLGILHIHPWSWLPSNSHMWTNCMHVVDFLLLLDEVVMEHSPRSIIICFFLSCILEGALS